MKFIKDELDNIKKELVEGFCELIPNNVLSEFVLKGSKFIRATLAIYYLKSLGCEITNNVKKILAAGELIHSASLLHDDVVDNADIRRGETTISKKFNDKISILSGDYLLSVAVDKLLEINNKDVLKKILECTRIMSATEIEQYFMRGVKPLEDEYIKICKGKTATLFSAILQACALVSELDVERARKFSEIFGLSFQINNDLEKKSSLEDKQNQIFTAKDIIGIEKTILLLDNYKEDMREMIKDFPQNIYKEGLEDLINSL